MERSFHSIWILLAVIIVSLFLSYLLNRLIDSLNERSYLSDRDRTMVNIFHIISLVFSILSYLSFLAMLFVGCGGGNKENKVEPKPKTDTVRIKTALNLVDSFRKINKRNEGAFFLYDSILKNNTKVYLDSVDASNYSGEDE